MSDVTPFSSRVTLCFRVSNKHIYAQLIHDARILFAVSTISKGFKDMSKSAYSNTALSKLLAEFFVENCPDYLKGCKISFDRGKRVYTGVVAVFADILRSNGFKF